MSLTRTLMQSHAILLLKYIYLILKMFIFTEHHDKENYFWGGVALILSPSLLPLYRNPSSL